MSLILEALKKSEAERRLGRAPDLFTAPPGGAVRRPARRGGFALGLGLALVALGPVVWWLLGRMPDAPAPAAVEAPSVAPGSAPPPARASTRRVAPIPRALPAPDPARAPAPLPRDPEFAARERESAAVAAGSEPSDGDPMEGAVPMPSRPVSAAPVVPTVAPAPAPVAEPLEALPSLAWLTAAEREGLPPLRLSMHVYDPDPAARFVLIDGHRLRQGDTVADGLVVEAIRPDGVVLDRRGRRFLLMRP